MTQITRMEMRGFKSFANKTELLFGGNFNVVLGPNGSGKSNIMDALCFVLGKSSAKSLRAEKSANLIYNGGKKKNPAKDGEVSIYFDNSKKTFPVPDDSVKLTRIVRQSGQSVYKINNKAHTRQQVLDLLSSARINPNGYNIILQGDITRFIEMSAVERRQIIEQVAGISVYEEKKQKALNELSKVEEKLKEAEIILSERESNLKELKRDRDQALKYKELDTKIVEAKASYLKVRIDKKTEEKGRYDKRVTEEENKISRLGGEIEKSKKTISEKKQKISRITKKIEEEGEEEQLKLSKEIEMLRVNIATNKERMKSLEKELVKIKERKEQLLVNVKDLKEKTSVLESQRLSLSTQKSVREKELKTIEDKIAVLKKKNKLDNADSLDTDMDSLDKQIEEGQKEMQDLREQQQNLLRVRDKLDLQVSSIDEKIERVLNLEKENKKQFDDLKHKKQEFKKTTVELNKSINDDSSLSAQLSNARSRLLSLKEDYSKLKAKSFSIEETVAGNVAVKKILEQKGSIGGIYGTLSQLGNVNSDYSTALQVAAGHHIKSVAVESDRVGATCIKYLKSNKLGTATFLPLNKISPRNISAEARKFSKSTGVIGFAIELIDFDPKFRSLFSYVFGDALVVENIDVARRIGVGTIKMVTLDGDFIERSGAMHGGFRKKLPAAGFQEKAVASSLEKKDREIMDVESVVSRLEHDKKNNEDKISKLREVKAHLEGDIIKLEKILYIDSEDINVNKKQKEDLEKEIKSQDKQVDELQNKISDYNRNLAGLKIKKQELKAKIATLRNPALLAELNTFEEKRIELREEIMKIDSEAKNIGMQISTILGPENENSLKIIKQHEKEERDFREEKTSLNKLIKEQESELKQKEGEAKKFYGKFKEMFSQRSRLNDEIQKEENSVDLNNSKISDLRNRCNILSLENAKIKAELSILQEDFEQYKDVSLVKKPEEELKRELARLGRMAENIGNLNMRALEIYEKVEAEYKDLVDKKETLMVEKEDVLVMMNEVESKKKELFMKSFTSLTEQFQTIFSQLSTKGDAYLALENEEDPLDGGLMVKVRLSGKKYLDIRSLSGGEKTMTALAFIFAIQEYDPATFYIFDEVDAALDKRNSEKLAHLIRKYSEKAQYIVISHNDGVISEGDNLYGISMDEHGVSKVVSLKI